MNGTQAHAVEHPGAETHVREETRSKAAAGGSIMEAFGAIATIALAIVGLAGVWPMLMASIATIVVGAATMMEGGALGLRQQRLLFGSNAGDFEVQQSEGTMGMDFTGGLTGVVLGILALLGVAPMTLVSIAVLALGASFLFSGRFFVGIGAVVLGILAVCGLTPTPLFLVGLLILGAGLLLSGSALTARTLTTRHA